MAKYEYDYTSVKITKDVHRELAELARKEGYPIKETLKLMLQFFHNNNVSIKDKIDNKSDKLDKINSSIKDIGERIIKINKNFEKLYFEPTVRTLEGVINTFDKMSSHVDNLSEDIEKDNTLNGTEKETNDNTDVVIIKRKNQELIEIITDILSVDTMVKTSRVNGEQVYHKSFTESTIKSLLDKVAGLRYV